MYKLLIVEDDETIAHAVAKHLEGWGYCCVCADDFAHITEQFASQNPQLVLMDISLPFYNGFYWCAEIRKLSSVPILFLSSAGDNMSLVMAINMGGDDFLAKPFDFDVLVAKVQALLRRAYDFSAGASLIEHKGVILNLSDASATCRGESLELTKNESRILQVLFERRGTVVARETLMQRLWETDLFVDENTLTVNIARLRRKLEAKGVPDLIVTKKGLGYMVE